MRIVFLSIVMMLAAFGLKAADVSLCGSVDAGRIPTTSMFISYDGVHTQPVNVDAATGKFKVTLNVDATSIVYIGAKLNGGKSNIFLPLIVRIPREEIVVNLEDVGGELRFVTADADNEAIAKYYMDFIPLHLRSQLSSMQTITRFLTRITEVSDSLAATVQSPEVGRCVSMIGYFVRVQMTRQLQENLRMGGQRLSQEALSGLKDTRELLKTDGVYLFRNDLVPLVISDIAIGRGVDERMKRVRAEVHDSALVAMVEAQLKADAYVVKGGEMPDVEIHDVDGNPHKLSEFKGKYMYVDFWASWCGPCNQEIPHLKRLEETLGNENVVFVAISIDEDVDSWKSAIKRHDLHGHQFIGNQELTSLLKIRGIPRYMIYDKDGYLLDPNAPRPSSGNVILEMLKGLK